MRTVALAVGYLLLGLSISTTLFGAVPHPPRSLCSPLRSRGAPLWKPRWGAVLLTAASAALLAGVLASGALAFTYRAAGRKAWS